MKVSELGEFGLIDLLAKAGAPAGERLIIGIGDDACAWRTEGGTQLATMDSLFEGVHFSLDYTAWEELGWKALASNLSDIAAMGGAPEYALVSVSLPGDTEVEQSLEMYRGMAALADKYGVTIAGGDTCRAPLVSITIAVAGRANAGGILRRSSARLGDLVAVTGALGGAAGGLKMLRNALSFPAGETESLRKAFLHPEPRVNEGQFLAEHGVKAAIDVSDGLAADLGHICRASGVGASLNAADIPLHPALKKCFPERALEMALGGGEDYELVFTAPGDAMAQLRERAAFPFTVIGEITGQDPGRVRILDRDGRVIDIPSEGWQHFTREGG